MDAESLVYHYLVDGINKNHNNHVGIELEFPLARVTGEPWSPEILPVFFEALKPLGFTVNRRASDGSPLAATDAQHNCFTFDTCYENVEFAMASAKSLLTIRQRFEELRAALYRALEPYGYRILGVGYNPFVMRHRPHLLENELTEAIAEYIRTHPTENRRHPKDFYCAISSEQVHFNTTEEELPLIFEAFTRLDWVNLLLFADSPMTLDEKHYLCGRNELYLRSPLRELGLVGAQALGPVTAQEMARTYLDKGMFMRKRDGRTELFPPVSVRDYFTEPRYGAIPEDVQWLDLGGNNILTTRYGTVEYRVLCTQPFSSVFTPSAFNLGLRVMLAEVLELMRGFDATHEMPEPDVRTRMASRGIPAFTDRKEVRELTEKLVALSEAGLRKRGLGEEILLQPLTNRKDWLDSPAVLLSREERTEGQFHAWMARGED